MPGKTGSQSLSGLRVIVIGAGFAGLAAAIELAQAGAAVQLFEAYRDLSRQGDVIRFEANASRVMQPWAGVLDAAVNAASPLDKLSILDRDGRLILDQALQPVFEGYPNVYINRGHVQRLMFDYAATLGVELHLNSPVTEVFETETSACVNVRGERYESDCVVAGDGVRSKARVTVTGSSDKPRKSGFAIYRSWFPLDTLRGDETVRHIAESEKPVCKIWIAEEAHAILTTNINMQAGTCFLTHKDLSDIHEDWNQRGEVSDMLAGVEGWDEELRHIIQHIPPDSLIDHKMLWRDPVKTWVSKNGRICLVGDAAHPHLPTSGTGAAQAFEDAATIAALLLKSTEKRGVPDIGAVFKAYERLRYERTSLTQRMGWETRHVWHQTDWDGVAKDPSLVEMPQPGWLLGHDARRYATENFEAVMRHLEEGADFASTNVPKGHVHEEWTVDMLLSREGHKVEADFYKVRNNG